MNKNDILLLLLALSLLLAALATIFLGGDRSRHGYGLFSPALNRPAGNIAMQSKSL